MSKWCKIETPWARDFKGIGDWSDMPGYYGFVYLITNEVTGQKYVGRKYFISRRKIKVKGKKRRVLKVTESDWKFYKGSSETLLKDIASLGIHKFSFTILKCYRTRQEVNYAETKELFARDVLYKTKADGSYEYYNENIMSRYFRPKVKSVKTGS